MNQGDGRQIVGDRVLDILLHLAFDGALEAELGLEVVRHSYRSFVG
jgi:hypothetical protein